jgi:plasmid stabilization system protein ParE
MSFKSPKLSRQALADLEQIWLYVAMNNLPAADKLLDGLYKRIQQLGEMPNLGHLRTDLAKEPLLFISVKHYLIVYRLNGKAVEVVRILSSYRDILNLLD